MLKLNRATFEILIQLEKDLPVPLFTRERDTYKRDKRSSRCFHEGPELAQFGLPAMYSSRAQLGTKQTH